MTVIYFLNTADLSTVDLNNDVAIALRNCQPVKY